MFYDYEGDINSFSTAVRDCISLFVTAVAIGLIACVVVSGLAMHFIHQAQTATSVAIVEKVASAGNPVFHFLALFLNNLTMCLLMLAIPYLIQRRWGKYLIFGSIISLGILTGAVVLVVTMQHNTLFMLSSLLPHGIFELNAFFFCTAYSLMVMRQENFYTSRPLKELWEKVFRELLAIVIPAIFLAAVVETFITPVLMSMTI